ncbi:hypothetical protein AB0J28_25760 [Streptosporangium canum]|uniref:hypothetical protein n=1 Tax=Streptosporangium canum TaxID=324952 RepID=UPI003441B95B
MDPNVFVPDLIKPFWPFITGGAFPEGEYPQISGKAVELTGLADTLRRFRLESGGAVAHLLDTGAWDGAAKEEFARLFGKLVASTGGAAGQGGGGVEDPVAVLAYVEDLVRRQAAGTQQHATDIEHTQWMMIAGAVLTATMIAKLRLFAMANPGVTPLIWSRLAFTRMENQMIKAHLLRNTLMFGGIMGGLDFGVQAGQKLAGHREEFNVSSLVWSGGTGALTGLLFGGMTFGASRLVSDDMVGVVAKDGVRNLRGLLAGAPNTVVGQAAMGGVAATAASVPMLAVNGQLDSEHLFFSVASGVLGGIGPTAVHPDAVTGGSGVPDGGPGGGSGDRSGGGSGDRSGGGSGDGFGGGSRDGFGGGPGDGARPGGAPEGRGPTPPPEGSSPSPSPDRTSLAASLEGGASGDHGVASGHGSSGGGGSNGRVVADRGDGAVPARAADGVLPVQAGAEGAGRAGERVAPGGADGTRPARPAEGNAPAAARAGADGPAAEGEPALRAVEDHGGPAVAGAGHDGGPVPSRPGSDAAPAAREGEAARQAPASERQTATASDPGAPVRVAGDGVDSATGAPVIGRARQDGSAELPAGAEADHRGPASSSAAPGRRDGQPIAETVSVSEDGHSVVAAAPTTPPRTEPARPDTPPGDPSFNKVQEHLPPSSTRLAPAQPSGNVRSASDGPHTADPHHTEALGEQALITPLAAEGAGLSAGTAQGSTADHLPAAPLERHIPLPRPEDLQLERGADGLIEKVDGSSVHDFVADMTRSRGLEYRTRRQEQTDLAFSDQKAGPVLSILMDRKTGRLYEGVNDMIVVPDDLHPLLRERFDRLTDWSEDVGPFDHGPDYPPGASPHFSEPGTHAEVTAVSKALFDRTARGETVTPATLQELYFDNRWIRVIDDLERAPCCANCTHFLYDVPNPAGYYSRYPHDGVTVETFTPPYI